MSFGSEIFHLDPFRCQLKFTFHLQPTTYFDVNYVAQSTDKAFPLNGYHRITFILHDQLDNKPNRDFVAIFEPTFCDWTNGTLVRWSLSKESITFLHSRWLKNGKVQVKIVVEPFNLLTAFEPYNYGTTLWKIDNYNDIRESYRYGRQYSLSETFYSSKKGYRMKGYLFIGVAVNVGLYFLKGPWDKQLPKKFKHRTTINIISQQNLIKDKIMSIESNSLAFDDFSGQITEPDLEKYVKDDSLIISFRIEAI